MNQTMNMLRMPAALLFLFALAGCFGGGPGRYDVVVKVDEMYKDQHGQPLSLEVHVCGLTKVENERWAAIPVADYFANARANDRTVVMKFGQGLEPEQKLLRKDPIWQKWEEQGVEYLYIAANLPGVSAEKMGGNDPRKLCVPLNTSCWKSWNGGKYVVPIRIEAPPNGVTCARPYDPKKAE
jgi:hypothetical protein